MAVLTAVLPVAQGVACYAALVREAQSRVAQGDPRTGGQLMADTLVARVTGQNTAEGVPVEVNVVMTDAALFGVGCEAAEPAIVEGFGPIPAEVAREFVKAPGSSVPRWARRLYRHPRSGELVALDVRRRKFTKGQRQFIRLRDQCCRTPWCEAPIRHFDHIVPRGRGGPTAVVNGEGYCAACNLAKEAPGWSARAEQEPHGRHRVVLTTPTGHEYASEPPPLPGASMLSASKGQVA
jgi:hypothetical protein